MGHTHGEVTALPGKAQDAGVLPRLLPHGRVRGDGLIRQVHPRVERR